MLGVGRDAEASEAAVLGLGPALGLALGLGRDAEVALGSGAGVRPGTGLPAFPVEGGGSTMRGAGDGVASDEGGGACTSGWSTSIGPGARAVPVGRR